ncbi:hypothetical protein [Haloquadratum walsbyi]|nr:hypothetical protein [Haloquadratum walsbyi]
MNKWRSIPVAIAGTVIMIAAGHAIFAGVLIGTDVASYTPDGVTVSDLSCEDALEGADTAGYIFSRVWSSGFHTAGTDTLDTELGSEYKLFRFIRSLGNNASMGNIL